MPQVNFMVLDPNDYYQAPCPTGLLIAVAVETRVDVIASNLDDLIKKAQEVVSYYVNPPEPQTVTIAMGDQRSGQPRYQVTSPRSAAIGLPEAPHLGVIARWINGDYQQAFVVDY